MLNPIVEPRRRGWARSSKSGCPALIKLSLKVERDTVHGENSGFVAPV